VRRRCKGQDGGGMRRGGKEGKRDKREEEGDRDRGSEDWEVGGVLERGRLG